MPRDDNWQGQAAPVLVFDLDGTVLRVNSFPYWALFLIAGSMRGIGASRRVHLALRAARLVLLRKLRLIDHAALLGGLQRAWSAIPAAMTGALADPLQTMLLRRIRSNLRPLLQSVASERVDAVLATAAAGEYAQELGRRIGFRHVLATPAPGHRAARINSGDRKRATVLAFLERAGWQDRPLVLFTDHIDDLPLMRKSALVCWFGPDARAQEACEEAEGVDFVRCLALDARQIAAAVAGSGALGGARSEAPQAARVASITVS